MNFGSRGLEDLVDVLKKRLGVSYINAQHGFLCVRHHWFIGFPKIKTYLISVFAAFQRHQVFKEVIGNSYYINMN